MPIVAEAGVAVRGDLKPFLNDLKGGERAAEALGEKLSKALSPRALSANMFGKGPAELARSFDRAADSADEAFEAVRRLDRQNIDTRAARKYADVLDEIGIEAQQTLADLRELQRTDPRFNTPQMKAAADQLDRVGREAADSARSLREIKGVGASTEFERMAHEAREASTALDSTGKRTDGLLGKLKGLKGALIGLGIGVGIHQVVGFTGDAIQSFSQLEQSVRSVETIFGESAGVITAWGDRAADAAGLSRREVNQAAAVMGQTLLNMGYNARDAADMVVILQQRAADLALAFGTDPQDALLAFGSVLRGERDTIEKFGVSIKQGDVNARVLALGLDTSTTEAKKNAEAIATLGLVLEQSANQAGRFSSSTGDIAVQLSQVEADAENAKAKLGEFAATATTNALANLNQVSEAGEAVGRWIYENKINGALATEDTRNYLKAIGVEWEDYTAKVRTLILDQGMSFEDAVDAANRLFTGIGGNADAAASHYQAWGRAIEATNQETADNISGFTGTIVGEMEAGRIKMVEIALRTPGDIAQAYEDGRDAVVQAAEALKQAQEEGMTDADRLAYLRGELSSQALADGLNSNISEVRNRAITLREIILAEIFALEHRSYVAGAAIPLAMARGIYANAWNAEQAARRLAAGVSGFLPSSEPKNPDSPLRGITKVGGKIVDMIAGGIYGSLPVAEGASAALAGALSPGLPSGYAGGGGGVAVSPAGGPTYVLNVNGVPYEVSTPEEMVQQLIEMGAFGGDGRIRG